VFGALPVDLNDLTHRRLEVVETLTLAARGDQLGVGADLGAATRRRALQAIQGAPLRRTGALFTRSRRAVVLRTPASPLLLEPPPECPAVVGVLYSVVHHSKHRRWS
jgi:hypothetical protein